MSSAAFIVVFSIGMNVQHASAFRAPLFSEYLFRVFKGEIVVEKAGPVIIEKANRYSENTPMRAWVRYPLTHPRAGEVVTSFKGTLRFVEEEGTRYHTIQAADFGATFLPTNVQAVGGIVHLNLKSLSGHDVLVEGIAPQPARISVATRNALDGTLPAELIVRQWVDDIGGNDGIDWLQLKANDILTCLKTNSSGEAKEVFQSVDFIKTVIVECGGTQRDDGLNEIGISPKCSAFNGHRLNLAGQLTASIAHESRHAWVSRELRRNTVSSFIRDDDGDPATHANDDDHDFWPEYLNGYPSTNALIEAASSSRSDLQDDISPGGEFSQPGVQETDARSFGLDFGTVVGASCVF